MKLYRGGRGGSRQYLNIDHVVYTHDGILLGLEKYILLFDST